MSGAGRPVQGNVTLRGKSDGEIVSAAFDSLLQPFIEAMVRKAVIAEQSSRRSRPKPVPVDRNPDAPIDPETAARFFQLVEEYGLLRSRRDKHRQDMEKGIADVARVYVDGAAKLEMLLYDLRKDIRTAVEADRSGLIEQTLRSMFGDSVDRLLAQGGPGDD